MNLTRILTVFKKDCLDGAKNHQIILMVITPIILSIIFTNFLGKSKTKSSLPTLGIISNTQHSLLSSLISKGYAKELMPFKTQEELEAKILEGKVAFGLVLPKTNSNDSKKALANITILYPPRYPEITIKSLKNSFENKLMESLNIPPPSLPVNIVMQKVKGNANSANSFGTSMLPMLIVMAMGMMSLLGLPLSFVEEKEKGTLNALFLTPLTTSELILGKTLFSLCMISITIFMILVLNNQTSGSLLFLTPFILLGSMMCIFIGLTISAFARTQASVNALGTTIFFFFQLIPNLQKTSDAIKSIAVFIPSTYINSGINKAMFMDLNKVDIYTDLYIVAGLTLLAYMTAYFSLSVKKINQ